MFRTADGSSIDVEYWSRALRGKDGTQVGVVVTFVDTSDNNHQEAHRNFLARVVESSSDGIISKDLEQNIVTWNNGATKIYGYEAEEMLGKSSSILQLDDHDDEEFEISEAIRRGDEIEQYETKRKTKHGEVCDISLTVFPVFDKSANIIGSASIDRDISDRRKTHNELIHAKSAAELAESRANAANRSRAEFLANISHELRTPMNAIIGMIQLSLEESLEPTIEDYLSTAKNSANALLELVNELLDFSKIEAGKFEISPEPFSVFETVEEVARSLSAKAGEKGLELFCEVQNEIATPLIGDPRRLQQVVTNLVSNAIKFTEQGEVVITVKSISRSDDCQVIQFSVSDTGIGILEQDQERIFAPFAQADMSSTREHYGTGLGLSICKELLGLMESELELESEVGTGSCFSFEVELPIGDNNDSYERVPTELVKNQKVLIVDDNRTHLRILEKVFVNWSMQPITANSGEQAVRILKQKAQADVKISLALIDGMMPGMDGYELADRIHTDEALGKPATVIMHSPSELSALSEKKKEASVEAFVMKPVAQSDLMDAVIESLNLYEQPTGVDDLKASDDRLIKSLNVLLIEDLEANQKVAGAILRKRGHAVTFAHNGHVALEVLNSGEQIFDVILMDIQMPVMDGLQTTAAIRQLENADVSKLPIIAMTAHAMDEDREQCLAAGMDSYIPKPLDAKKLIWLTETVRHDPDRKYSSGKRRRPQPSLREKTMKELRGSTSSLFEEVAALDRLQGDQELLLKFIDIFQDNSPVLMMEIESAIKTESAEDLEKKAHALKGLISNFGAKPCVELASSLERKGRNKKLAKSTAEFQELSRLYNRLRSELDDYQRRNV
jgi:PAS domain S-box-containing protein